jgi:hypothetical protein
MSRGLFAAQRNRVYVRHVGSRDLTPARAMLAVLERSIRASTLGYARIARCVDELRGTASITHARSHAANDGLVTRALVISRSSHANHYDVP